MGYALANERPRLNLYSDKLLFLSLDFWFLVGFLPDFTIFEDLLRVCGLFDSGRLNGLK